nr:uncharacterized protein LOC127292342 isoform X1 [Lolium perenne]
MELFTHAKAVRLKSRHDKFLYADEDELRVTQDRKGSSPNARWTVETVPHAPGAIRLRSRYGRYLAASSEPFLLKGHKVVQAAPSPAGRPDASVEWEPVREGFHVRFKSRLGGGAGSVGGSGGKYLRANGGLPPWRNSVTHDVPNRNNAQEWVFWSVEVVQVITPAPATPAAAEPEPKLRPAAAPQEAHHRPTVSQPATPPRPVYTPRPPPSYAPPPLPTAKPEPKLESSYTYSAALHKVEGRAVHYHIADGNGEVGDNIKRHSFTFNGSNLEELTEKLKEETGIDDLIICTRSPINGKLIPILLRLPPNNAAMHIVLVRESSKVAETFPFPYGS